MSVLGVSGVRNGIDMVVDPVRHYHVTVEWWMKKSGSGNQVLPLVGRDYWHDHVGLGCYCEKIEENRRRFCGIVIFPLTHNNYR